MYADDDHYFLCDVCDPGDGLAHMHAGTVGDEPPNCRKHGPMREIPRLEFLWLDAEARAAVGIETPL
jgi:hypothetical protein